MDLIDLAYYAGVFDVAGRVRIRDQASLYVTVSDSNRAVLQGIQTRFGGSIYKNKSSWMWVASGGSAQEFLDSLLPYLRQRRAEAYQCLERARDAHRYRCVAPDVKASASPLQEKAYCFILDYQATTGIPPTLREIGKALGIASISHVRYVLMGLEKCGWIRCKRSTSRGIVLVRKQEVKAKA